MPNNYFDTHKPGEMAMRRCGCGFEYCDGCCNSCPKSQIATSDHTTPSLQCAITADKSYPVYYTDNASSGGI